MTGILAFTCRSWGKWNFTAIYYATTKKVKVMTGILTCTCRSWGRQAEPCGWIYARHVEREPWRSTNSKLELSQFWNTFWGRYNCWTQKPTNLVDIWVKDWVKLLLLVLVVVHQMSLHGFIFLGLCFHHLVITPMRTYLTSIFCQLSAKILSMVSLYLHTYV